MKQIFVYVNAIDICPSGYYRILQYFDRQSLKVRGLMPASVYRRWHSIPAKVRQWGSPFLFLLMFCRTLVFLTADLLCAKKNDILIINRTISPHYLLPTHTFLLKLFARKCRVIWDFDDNLLEVHTISQKEHNLLSEISDTIVVTGEFLKSLIPTAQQSKVRILPTTDGDMVALDHEENERLRKKIFDDEIHLVWVGSGSNLCYVERILPALEQCAQLVFERYCRRLILDVVTNLPLQSPTQYLTIHNIVWTREAAIAAMQKAHIGIMPLTESPFTLGKGGFKLIQYLSVGLPVVGSAVGYNVHVIHNETCGRLVHDASDISGWTQAILDIITSWDTYSAFSQMAYRRYDEAFSFQRNKNVWHSLIKVESEIPTL